MVMSVTAMPFQNGYTDGFDVFIVWRVGGVEKESANRQGRQARTVGVCTGFDQQGDRRIGWKIG